MYVYKNPLPQDGTFIPLTKDYYDNYDWTNVAYNDDYNTYLNTDANAAPNQHPWQCLMKP